MLIYIYSIWIYSVLWHECNTCFHIQRRLLSKNIFDAWKQRSNLHKSKLSMLKKKLKYFIYIYIGGYYTYMISDDISTKEKCLKGFYLLLLCEYILVVCQMFVDRSILKMKIENVWQKFKSLHNIYMQHCNCLKAIKFQLVFVADAVYIC